MSRSSEGAKKRFLTVLTALFGLGSAVVIIEGGVRVLMPQEDIAEWFQKNEELGFSLRPNYSQAFHYRGHDFVMNVQTNSHGFRDEELDWSLSFEGRRIVFLGDSFVFGYGIQVEDRLDTRLAEFCGKGGDPIQTINCGTPGWGTRQETAYVLKHLEVLRPDVAVLVFCGNDPENDRGLLGPVLSDENSPLFKPKRLLRRHSQAYRLLLKQKYLFQYRRQAVQATGDRPPARPELQIASVISEADWRSTLDGITGFHHALLEHNPNAVLLVLAASPDNEDTREQLTKLSALPGLEYLDLAERYSAVPPEDRRIPWDGHWSPEIHRLAAEELYAWLTENRIIDAHAHRAIQAGLFGNINPGRTP